MQFKTTCNLPIDMRCSPIHHRGSLYVMHYNVTGMQLAHVEKNYRKPNMIRRLMDVKNTEVHVPFKCKL